MTPTQPVTGDKAPDIIVKDSANNEFRLTNHIGNGRNVMFLLYRGHW